MSVAHVTERYVRVPVPTRAPATFNICILQGERSRAHRGTIPKRFVDDWMRLLAERGVGGLGGFRGDCGGVLGVDVSGVFSAKRAASAVRPSTVNRNVVSVSRAFLSNNRARGVFMKLRASAAHSRNFATGNNRPS